MKPSDIGVKAMTVTKLVEDTLDGINHDLIVKQLGKSVDPMLKQARN